MKKILWVTALSCGQMLSSCLQNNEPDTLTADRAARLLALDTGKIWLRIEVMRDNDTIELADCEIENFFYLGSINQSDTAFYIGAASNCSVNNSDTLGRWSFEVVGNIREEFQDSVKFTDESGETLFRKITELTSNNLRWEFVEGEVEIEERFTWLKDPEN